MPHVGAQKKGAWLGRSRDSAALASRPSGRMAAAEDLPERWFPRRQWESCAGDLSGWTQQATAAPAQSADLRARSASDGSAISAFGMPGCKQTVGKEKNEIGGCNGGVEVEGKQNLSKAHAIDLDVQKSMIKLADGEGNMRQHSLNYSTR